MAVKLLIFETHPIQYRAPIYVALQKLIPNQFYVIYASDFSLHGYRDSGFSAEIAWDTPLLLGYPNLVLQNATERGIDHWSGLHGAGVADVFGHYRPKAVLLSSFRYKFSWRVILESVAHRAKLWIRVETQDEANVRSRRKAIVRYLIYWTFYKLVSHAFYIGEANRRHLHLHGLKAAQLSPARYCAVDCLAKTSGAQREARRMAARMRLHVRAGSVVVAFFGKLVEKKDPLILLKSVPFFCDVLREKVHLLFVGSGAMESELKQCAFQLEEKLQVSFVGFVNQQAIGDYYLASDVVVLPSKKMGETWGLVINEALQAGCSIVVSDNVGCRHDFSMLERFRVFPSGNAEKLAGAIHDVARFPRDLFWCADFMRNYSVEMAAEALAAEVGKLQ